jgi:hypothetical protein
MEAFRRMAITLDDVVPDPQFRERHERRIAAPPAAVWDALQELRLSDTTLSRALMAIRLLPARLAGRRPTMASGRLLETGPLPRLGGEPGRCIVAGGVMQPWKLTGGDDPPALDAVQLRAFERPGWVKAAFDFVLEPDGDGTLVSTETRVSATDARTRARFGIYWMLIRAGSGLIRRDLLRELARRATTDGPATARGAMSRV